MLSKLFLLGVIASLCAGAHANQMVEAYDSAMEMKEYYDEEIEYWRRWLTIEADDMDYFFGDLVIDGIQAAYNAAQGAGIARCTAQAAETSRNNIIYMDDVLLRVQEVSNDLHQSAYGIFKTMEIDELSDFEYFYYYHSYEMAVAYYDLWYYYSDLMYYAWLTVFYEFFDVYYDLYYCIDDVLSAK